MAKTTAEMPPIPKMLHHTAYMTMDTEATVDFYCNVLGLELVSAVVDDEVPSTGDPFPYLHLFFRLGDGSTIAFFEAPGIPAPAPSSHPAYNVFNHLALDVKTKENVDRWAERLEALGVDHIGPVDHGIIYSVYFRDPNGHRLELTTTTDPSWQEQSHQAQDDVTTWLEAKSRMQGAGDKDALKNWILERRKRHKQAHMTTGPVEK